MNKTSYFFVAILILLVAFVAYKIGDSKGFQTGYEAGHIYDCKDEVKSLREANEELKKAVDFSKAKASEIQVRNYELEREKFRLEHLQDSIDKAPEVARKNDSLKKAGYKYTRANPYTGQIRGVDVRDLVGQSNKK